MKKWLSILLTLSYSYCYSQFNENCIRHINTSGLNENISRVFKDNKSVLITHLNAIIPITSINLPNICNVSMNISYNASKRNGIIEFQCFYDEILFWEFQRPRVTELFSLKTPYFLALAITEYKRALIHQTGNSDLNNFDIKIKFIKENSTDFISFYLKGWTDTQFPEADFYKIKIYYNKKEYKVTGHTEGFSFYHDKLYDINGRKLPDYYFFKFFDAI